MSDEIKSKLESLKGLKKQMGGWKKESLKEKFKPGSKKEDDQTQTQQQNDEDIDDDDEDVKDEQQSEQNDLLKAIMSKIFKEK